jgi:hypothetical protein
MFVYPRMISPFYTCHIDLAGPFPTTLKGNVWILVFKDALSKWTEIFALRDKTAESVVECFVDEIVMRHGAPHILVSDNGTEFCNSLLSGICAYLRVRKVSTAPYTPKTNGLVERQMGTMKGALNAYTNVFQTDWDDYLPLVAHYYRTTVHSQTGYTPYFMMYGRECQRPDELWVKEFNDSMDDSEVGQEIGVYVRSLSEALQIIWEIVGEQYHEKSMDIADKRNQGKRFKTFKAGDEVMLEAPPKTVFISAEDHQRHKVTKSFSDRYSGPYKVLKKISPMSYLIQRGKNQRVQNVSRLKLYKQRGTRRVREKELGQKEDTEVDAAQKEDTSNSSDESDINT